MTKEVEQQNRDAAASTIKRGEKSRSFTEEFALQQQKASDARWGAKFTDNNEA